MKLASFIFKTALLAVLVISGTTLIGFSDSVAATLSDDEAADLTFQREEEKLARDVYLALYDQWGAAIFSNIAASEQKHMDTLKKMLDQYKLPDPALPAKGDFTNEYLQFKYDELVATGLVSYEDGLYVGATIEEIDMIDIQKALDGTKRLDLRTAYQNLLEGSNNHLRAFVAGLAAQGIIYTPQFINQEFYDAIIGL